MKLLISRKNIALSHWFDGRWTGCLRSRHAGGWGAYATRSIPWTAAQVLSLPCHTLPKFWQSLARFRLYPIFAVDLDFESSWASKPITSSSWPANGPKRVEDRARKRPARPTFDNPSWWPKPDLQTCTTWKQRREFQATLKENTQKR